MLQCNTPDVTSMKEIVRLLMIFYVIFVTIKFGGAYADKCEKPLPKHLIAVKQKTRRK